MFISKGKLIYDPIRNMEKNTKWWCVLEIDEEIARYYRNFVDKEWVLADHSTLKRRYLKPPHKAHISIIRGEKPQKNIQDWNKYKKGKLVSFKYSNKIRQTSFHKDGKDYFWFIEAIFPEYNQIRSHFGLPTQRNGNEFKGHITIATTDRT